MAKKPSKSGTAKKRLTAKERHEQELRQIRRALKLHRERVKAEAGFLLPILQKESDWDVVTGAARPDKARDDAYVDEAVVRLTKKAAQLICPGVRVHVRRDPEVTTWINVDLGLLPGSVPSENKDLNWVAERHTRFVDDVLVALGIEFYTFCSDGPDVEHHPCLQVLPYIFEE